MYIQIEDNGKLAVFANDDDICYRCANMHLCPLMESLQAEVIILRYSNITVSKCGLFKKLKKGEALEGFA